jgi:hypothetical protein
MNERQAWECPRCNRMNAPHADYCDCASGNVSPDFVPLPPVLQPPTSPYRITWRIVGDPPITTRDTFTVTNGTTVLSQ